MNADRTIPAIEATLAAFLADPEPYIVSPDSPLDLRTLAAELQLLPVMLDMGGCLGLRSDGEVVSFSWDEPRQLRVEHDERIRNVALFRASLEYALLGCLMPRKPATAVTCPHCGGSGRISGLPQDLVKTITCHCGGLGWLPKASD